VKTIEELAGIACKAVKTITDETTNSAELLCVIALMQSSLQSSVSKSVAIHELTEAVKNG